MIIKIRHRILEKNPRKESCTKTMSDSVRNQLIDRIEQMKLKQEFNDLIDTIVTLGNDIASLDLIIDVSQEEITLLMQNLPDSYDLTHEKNRSA